MDKYDGMSRPEVSLSENKFGDDAKIAEAPLEVGYSEKGSRDTKISGELRPVKEPTEKKKSCFLKSFLLRAVASAAVIAFMFLPRIFAYEGSEKVTEGIKSVVMTDITKSEKVGEGKLVDIISALFGGFGAG